MSLTAPQPPQLPPMPPGWQHWLPDEKRKLLAKLRSVRRADSIDRAWQVPSELAVDLFDGYVHVPHLDPIDEAFADADQRKAERILICYPPQVGKPVAASSLVLMADGSRRRIDEIGVGDRVISGSGLPRPVTAVYRQGALPTVRIITRSGRSTVAALDHPFLTPRGYVDAGALTPQVRLGLLSRPATESVSGLEVHEARLLGYVVGDGSVSGSNASVTSFDDAVTAEILRCADKLGFAAVSRQRGRVTLAGSRPWLRRHELADHSSWTKRVPADVFTADDEAIGAFIGAYWDCDGVVSSRGKDRAGGIRPDVMCEVYSVSRNLLADVQHLLLRLGIRSAIRTKIGSYQDAEHISYRLTLIRRDDVARFRDLIPLVHTEKARRLAAHPYDLTEFDAHIAPDEIVAVEPAGEQNCLCLTVVTDHTFTSDDFIVHNSTTAAEAGPLWWLSRHPSDRATVASYAAELAERRGRRIRDTIATYGERLGLELTAGSRAVARWDLTTGGGMLCMGVSGSLTGFGSDFMVVDDPHKDRAEANSKTMRDAVWDWYQSTVATRMAPDAPVILIMTRWHPDDLAARVLANEGREDEGGRWRILSLPAVAEDKDPKTGVRVLDPLGRAAGDPLTHPKLPGADRGTLLSFWVRKRKEVGAREWPALYQQRPAPPEGAIFKHEWISSSRVAPADLPELVRRVVSVDPSATATQRSDECGIVVCGKDEKGEGYVLADLSAVLTPADWGRRVCIAYLDWDANEIVAEQNQGYEMVQDVIRNAWDKLVREAEARVANAPPGKRAAVRAAERILDRVAPRVVKVHSRIGKVLRAEPIAAVYEDLKAHHVGDDLDQLEDQMTSWTGEGDSPDRVDALVHGLTHLLKGPTGEGRSYSMADLTV